MLLASAGGHTLHFLFHTAPHLIPIFGIPGAIIGAVFYGIANAAEGTKRDSGS